MTTAIRLTNGLGPLTVLRPSLKYAPTVPSPPSLTPPGAARTTHADHPTMCPVPRWFRRLSLIGFSFFLIKGLMWLAVLWLGAASLTR